MDEFDRAEPYHDSLLSDFSARFEGNSEAVEGLTAVSVRPPKMHLILRRARIVKAVTAHLALALETNRKRILIEIMNFKSPFCSTATP